MSARDLVGDWEYKVIYPSVENAGARRPVLGYRIRIVGRGGIEYKTCGLAGQRLGVGRPPVGGVGAGVGMLRLGLKWAGFFHFSPILSHFLRLGGLG